jgi:hypothetical protein
MPRNPPCPRLRRAFGAIALLAIATPLSHSGCASDAPPEGTGGMAGHSSGNEEFIGGRGGGSEPDAGTTTPGGGGMAGHSSGNGEFIGGQGGSVDARPEVYVESEPPSYTFPLLLVGATASAEFRLRNTSASLAAALDELGVGDVNGGRPSTNFAVDRGTCGATLEPGATCALSVRFAPTSPGRKWGEVTALSAGPVGTRFFIEVHGLARVSPARLGDPCTAEIPCSAGTCQGGFCTRPCDRSADCEPNSEGRRSACVVVASAGRCLPGCDSGTGCYQVAGANCWITRSVEGASSDVCFNAPLPPANPGLGGAGGGGS